jgi:hypothetical protein
MPGNNQCRRRETRSVFASLHSRAGSRCPLAEIRGKSAAPLRDRDLWLRQIVKRVIVAAKSAGNLAMSVDVTGEG